MRDYKLPRRTLFLWQLRTVIIELLLLCVCGYLNLKFRLLLILFIDFTIFFLLLIIWYIPSYFKSCKIRLSNDGIIIRRGVIIKNTHILPFSRLIYTQTLVTPLAKLFGLKAVTLKAARSRLFVPEMNEFDADSLLTALANGEKQ